MSEKLQNFAKFQQFQLDNLVDFEKYCKMRFDLQRSAPIQPKTSENLPKIGCGLQLVPDAAELAAAPVELVADGRELSGHLRPLRSLGVVSKDAG